MGLNFLAIVLAIANVLDPVSGALVHNAGSVLVIINSALLLRWKKRWRCSSGRICNEKALRGFPRSAF